MKVYTILFAAIRSAKTPETKNRLEEITWAPDYAEPGYSLASPDKKAGIYLGNWNPPTTYDPVLQRQVTVLDGRILPRVKEALEKAGANTEWCDEWALCHDCSKIARTVSDGYDWQSSLIVNLTEASCLCKECHSQRLP